MMDAWAVMGAGFGDEGKGLLTDYLVRRLEAPLVGRFNGGGQAGHTVVTPEGQRHIFSHVGAGTLAGADTLLGRRFILNPYVLDAEMAELKALGQEPGIYCHPDAPVTTVFDMALNAAAELERGKGRHGSCGLGINETVTRHERGFTLTARDLRRMSRAELAEQLKLIHQHWVPARLKELGIKDPTTAFHLKTGEVLKNDSYDEHAIRLMMGALHCWVSDDVGTRRFLEEDKPLVLEGAQGLALDEELGSFPHVTRSRTGLVQAMELASWCWCSTIRPIYVTRAYVTRHGAGPLKHEGESITPDGAISDTTNVSNEWQGHLRFAPLDLAELRRFIERDLLRAHQDNDDVRIEAPVLAITCLDQVGSQVTVWDVDGQRVVVPVEEVPSFIQQQVGFRVGYTSWGPTWRDVVPTTWNGV